VDRESGESAAVLQVFAIESVAAGFERRSNDQRIIKRKAIFARNSKSRHMRLHGERQCGFEHACDIIQDVFHVPPTAAQLSAQHTDQLIESTLMMPPLATMSLAVSPLAPLCCA
jgi:hypothetical protein